MFRKRDSDGKSTQKKQEKEEGQTDGKTKQY